MESKSQGKCCDAHHQEYAINYKIQILHLEKRLRKLGADIMLLQDNGYMVEELDIYIRELHNYNELKDIGQMLLGKLATPSKLYYSNTYSVKDKREMKHILLTRNNNKTPL